MEKLSTDGLVIKTSPTAEADLVVFILTRHRGVIRAFAKGARGMKSRLHAGVTLFAYCDFLLNEKNGVYYVNEAVVKNMFYELRTDWKTLTLAQYFCEIALKTLPDGAAEPEYLRLLLNSLYLLANRKKDALLVKSVFELRAVSLSGYMPSIVACERCGAFQTDVMYFNCLTGALFCEECAGDGTLFAVPLSVVNAMRHIVFSQPEKCFSFDLPQEPLELLSRLSERYLEACFHRRFSLLEYLNALND